ncbi:hypothetical protein K435DRAFT_675101 [Dendrothele bispora CBS 962.96]|uniref:Uncharacterized protein n=1 Tax=Dendrothele bispora (strain CBS 962.96) TaxID=1314807 RepID=A0A4S8LNL0_DENBC|nr:hypothetical protein K435DRAFT_675101 [Dendrothele bispora CBS 962.96]
MPTVSVSRQFNDSEYANWSTYEQLPLDPSFPTKAAWGVWGAMDEFGALNRCIPPNTIKAAKNKIGAGIAISLNLEMNIPNSSLSPLRPTMLHGK